MTKADERTPSRILLLGVDEARFGRYKLSSDPERGVACALSVGGDVETPAAAAKGNPAHPNEDALLVCDQGSAALFAVADAHFGTSASHALLEGLGERVERVPGSPAALERLLRDTVVSPPGAPDRSETTLLAVVLRRDMRAGFGVSIGDSVCAIVGGGQQGHAVNRPHGGFVQPGQSWGRVARTSSHFDFELPPGALLLLFTDGISCCHYDRPLTSLGPQHLLALFEEVGPEPETYARRLTEWALAGRDGWPGGQDNIALIVATA